jgi:hypothetical protein
MVAGSALGDQLYGDPLRQRHIVVDQATVDLMSKAFNDALERG